MLKINNLRGLSVTNRSRFVVASQGQRAGRQSYCGRVCAKLATSELRRSYMLYTA